MKTLTTKTLTLSLGRTSNQVIIPTNWVMEAQAWTTPAYSTQTAVDRQAIVRIWCKTGVTIRYSSSQTSMLTVTTSSSNNTDKRNASQLNCSSLLKSTWMELLTQAAQTNQPPLKSRLTMPADQPLVNLARIRNLRTCQCAPVKWSSIDKTQAVHISATRRRRKTSSSGRYLNQSLCKRMTSSKCTMWPSRSTLRCLHLKTDVWHLHQS